MPDRLTTGAIDAELAPGARNAIQICLRLQPQERVTIITDEATSEIAAALQAEVEEVGSEHAVFVLENYARRPLTAMPEIILDDLARSQVSIFCAQTQPGELTSRTQMTDVVNKRHIRHAHMVNITRQIMLEGMRADFRTIDALSQRLIERARHAQRIKCRTPHGTDFEAELSPKMKWLKTSGIITAEKWGNLPGGEIFTAPANTNGTFVVDGVVGDYLCQKYGDLHDAPLTIAVENNRIRQLRSKNNELLEEFRAYTSTDENSNRVGEFAIGTNTACTHVIGNILQDEKIPGVHIAFGHPYAEHTGANWISKTHIDCVGRDFDIWFDGEQVMERGKFLV
ncbi:MAG TPA: aminopeptidase [Chthoniobacterales bacterium]|jgi:leucyl aminopeptidase (aminopeptidase T)|nr:aminopeptidase [Chthoniobacterales bacterium]